MLRSSQMSVLLDEEVLHDFSIVFRSVYHAFARSACALTLVSNSRSPDIAHPD